MSHLVIEALCRARAAVRPVEAMGVSEDPTRPFIYGRMDDLAAEGQRALCSAGLIMLIGNPREVEDEDPKRPVQLVQDVSLVHVASGQTLPLGTWIEHLPAAEARSTSWPAAITMARGRAHHHHLGLQVVPRTLRVEASPSRPVAGQSGPDDDDRMKRKTNPRVSARAVEAAGHLADAVHGPGREVYDEEAERDAAYDRKLAELEAEAKGQAAEEPKADPPGLMEDEPAAPPPPPPPAPLNGNGAHLPPFPEAQTRGGVVLPFPVALAVCPVCREKRALAACSTCGRDVCSKCFVEPDAAMKAAGLPASCTDCDTADSTDERPHLDGEASARAIKVLDAGLDGSGSDEGDREVFVLALGQAGTVVLGECSDGLLLATGAARWRADVDEVERWLRGELHAMETDEDREEEAAIVEAASDEDEPTEPWTAEEPGIDEEESPDLEDRLDRALEEGDAEDAAASTKPPADEAAAPDVCSACGKEIPQDHVRQLGRDGAVRCYACWPPKINPPGTGASGSTPPRDPEVPVPGPSPSTVEPPAIDALRCPDCLDPIDGKGEPAPAPGKSFPCPKCETWILVRVDLDKPGPAWVEVQPLLTGGGTDYEHVPTGRRVRYGNRRGRTINVSVVGTAMVDAVDAADLRAWRAKESLAAPKGKEKPAQGSPGPVVIPEDEEGRKALGATWAPMKAHRATKKAPADPCPLCGKAIIKGTTYRAGNAALGKALVHDLCVFRLAEGRDPRLSPQAALEEDAKRAMASAGGGA